MLMRADGLSFPDHMVNLTNNPADDNSPDWTPVGDFLSVSIDIKPGSFPNPINLGSNGNVPVAIFSRSDFDATIIDPLSITLAGAAVRLKGKGTPMVSFQDINGDGLTDLIVHIDTTALQLSFGDTLAILEGKTQGGKKIKGVDSVVIVQN